MSVPQVTRRPVLLRADSDLGFMFNILRVDVFCGVDVFRVCTRSARVVVVP